LTFTEAKREILKALKERNKKAKKNKVRQKESTREREREKHNVIQ